MTEETKKPAANVKFVAVRKVQPANGDPIWPGEAGSAPRAVVQKWLDVGAVKVSI